MVVGPENLSTRFMAALGLTVPEEFADAAVSDQLAPGTIGLSDGQAGRLDAADLLLMTFAGPGERATFESNPLVRTLSVRTEGRPQQGSEVLDGRAAGRHG
jgi:iron complex transport system substrate-binding protein